VIDNVSLSEPVMQDEIFGPILPVIEYDDLTEAIAIINQGRNLWLCTYFLEIKSSG